MKKNENNIIHITSEFSLKNYSITTFIIFLISKLQKNINSKVFVEKINLKIDALPPSSILLFKNKWLDFFNIKNRIIENNKFNTIFHLHGLWSPLQLYSLILLCYYNFSTVVHVHGMLLEPALTQNGHLKKFFKKTVLFILKILIQNKRVIFISITEEEKYAILKYFPYSKIFPLPNPIPFKRTVDSIKFKFSKKKIFTFFGRLHPHKNIEFIIDLFNKSKLPKNCYLHIYGINDDPIYLSKLKKLLKFNKNIKILKPVFGYRKSEVMRHAWVNILLSKSEVLSFSLLEAGLNGLPTLVNENFNLPKNDKISIRASDRVTAILEKFNEISNWPRTYRDSLFKNSINFFNNYKKRTDKFTITQILNIYKLSTKRDEKKNYNFYDFLINSFIFGFNYFLPPSLVVFFYLSGNAEIAAECGLFIILSTSITQIFSSNMRSLAISDKVIKIDLDAYFIFRFLFSIIYLIILFFFILPYWNLHNQNFVFFLCSIILFQWVFEVKLVRLELVNDRINQIILLFFFFIIGMLSILLALNNNIFILNYLLIVFSLFFFIFSLNKFLLIIKEKKNLSNSLFSLKSYFTNFSYLSLLSSFSIVFSGLAWRFYIYYLFEKALAGLLFAGLTLGSFLGTLFNLILGLAYVNAKIKLNNKIKYLFFLIFFILFFININIFYNLEYIYGVLKNYLYKIDKLFFIVAAHSLLGSFFMTYAMYQRHKMMFFHNIKNEIFILDFIYSLLISILLPLLYWFFNIDGVLIIYLFSSIIGVLFYKYFTKQLIKKYNVSHLEKK